SNRVRNEILNTVAAYHAVKKDDIDNLLTRIGKLQEVHDKIEQVFSQSKGLLSSWNANDVTFFRTKVGKRALTKKGYLTKLLEYYLQHKLEMSNPATLWNEVFGAPQQTAGGAIGLQPYARLEERDPVHRDFGFQKVALPPG